MKPLNTKFIISILVWITAFLSAAPHLAADDVKKPQLVKRRVVIFDFVNTQKAAEYSYLEDTIADAFLEPLDKTRNFEMLPRSDWKKLTESGEFKKEDAAREDTATRAGKKLEVDVVVIGSFAALSDHMQIFAKAVEIPSGRIILTRTKSVPLDSYMFDSISKLAEEMSFAMKDKLPPMEQKVVTRMIHDTSVTFGGMIWRNALLPGLGHVYAGQKRGWIYMGLWGVSAGAMTYFFIDYGNKLKIYQTATSGLEAKYAAANFSSKMRGYSLAALAMVYVVNITDTLIFGKGYEKIALDQVNREFLAISSPEISGDRTGVYTGWQIQMKF
ncbi:MAG: CsgG/HfaB family protein [Spirochaetia bacterium]|nr:CsgG/HfaB family protein [Spirochaetia bacterium]